MKGIPMALAFESRSIDVPATTGAGTPTDITYLVSCVVSLAGTWEKELSLELSFDGGTTYFAHADATALTANAAVDLGELGDAATHARVNVASSTSGVATCIIRGLDVRYL